MKRIFVAIKSSNGVRAAADEWRSGKESWPVRWVPSENLHITVIPPWDESDVGGVIRALAAAAAFEPFALKFGRVTYGPTPNKRRLIWARGDRSPELEALKKNIEKSLDIAGAKRELLPHITLARFRPEIFHSLKTKNLNEEINWEERIRSFELIESVLLPSGAKYETLKSFPFV